MHDQTQKESVHLKSNLMRKVGESQSKAVLSSAQNDNYFNNENMLCKNDDSETLHSGGLQQTASQNFLRPRNVASDDNPEDGNAYIGENDLMISIKQEKGHSRKGAHIFSEQRYGAVEQNIKITHEPLESEDDFEDEAMHQMVPYHQQIEGTKSERDLLSEQSRGNIIFNHQNSGINGVKIISKQPTPYNGGESPKFNQRASTVKENERRKTLNSQSNQANLDQKRHSINKDLKAGSNSPATAKSGARQPTLRSNFIQMIPMEEDLPDYQNNSPSKSYFFKKWNQFDFRKFADTNQLSLQQRGFTGGQSERSKKIVYQKGVNSSQNPSRLEASAALLINSNQAVAEKDELDNSDRVEKSGTQSVDFEIVRDIGISPVEDDSFLANDMTLEEQIKFLEEIQAQQIRYLFVIAQYLAYQR